MKKFIQQVCVCVVACALVACGSSQTSSNTPVGTSQPAGNTPRAYPVGTVFPTDTPAPEVAYPGPGATPTVAGVGPCFVRGDAAHEVKAYTRPSLMADVFGMLSPEEPLQVFARTADGWIGFDPGTAQAANTGLFRYRWVPEEGVILSGACDAVAVVVGPPAGICFFMPMAEVQVYAAPDASASQIASLELNDYAAVVGMSADKQWAKLDLTVGEPKFEQPGWVDAATLNFNGPCDPLPVATP